MSNFNYIASFYEPLAKLIFGNELYKAKMQFASIVKPDSRILILGGGTGDILNELLTSTENTKIDFVEPSKAMLEIARSNMEKEHALRVSFINGNHLTIQAIDKFDVVMLFFVLDVFKEEEAIAFSEKIFDSIKPDGTLLFADFFNTSNVFHRLLIFVMYKFFKITTGISANKLPDYEKLFSQSIVTLIDEKIFLKGLVRSRVYKRLHYYEPH